ncbi:uncharacterized protein LOC118202516 [Stegodyphus dumicola]|uniref:uncharacterized protein LOC118202516 n=1 Tax=Stegodyphus dumicola TaxID=202533 RepID=UPI0015AA06EA|nr:uncharacterized protein LOC118202516 [Stegodyphus dumicola]
MAEFLLGNFTKFMLFTALISLTWFITRGACCPSHSTHRGNVTLDFDVEIGSPMAVRCSIFHNRIKIRHLTYNVSSSNLIIKFDDRVLVNVTILDEHTIEYSKQNATVNDTGCYYCFVSIPEARTRRFVGFTYVSVGSRPSAPLNASFTNVMATSLILHWSPPEDVNYNEFQPLLTYSIRYRTVYDYPTLFQEMVLSFTNGGSAAIQGLIPYTEYQFNIRCKYNDSVGDMWSPSLKTYAITRSDVPYLAAEITNSSFVIEPVEGKTNSSVGRTITLYWKAIPEAHENGAEFCYILHVHQLFRTNEEKEALIGNETFHSVNVRKETKHSFRDMGLNSSYKFEIHTRNRVGYSLNSSFIIIEPDKLLDGPEEIIVMSSKYYFTISWKVVKNQVKYTLFWCKSFEPRPVNCEDSLQWVHLSSNSYFLPVFDALNYQFAVSTNSENRTSGMHWASCNISRNSSYSNSYLWEVCSNFIFYASSMGTNFGILYV